MTITTALPNAAKLDALKLLCPANHAYKVVLLAAGAVFDKTATVYDGTGEVPNGSGYATGGQALAGYAAVLDGDVAVLDFSDANWPNASISAAGALIVDTTDGNKIRGVFDFGGTIVSTNGQFSVLFPAPTATTAVIRIG